MREGGNETLGFEKGSARRSEGKSGQLSNKHA